MGERPTRESTANRLGFDELLLDIFGLNIRGLRTVGATIATPRRYFDAARDGDWHGRYTPSIRVWFSIITVMMLLRFIWAGDGSAIMNGTIAQFEAMQLTFADDHSAESAARVYVGMQSVATPFVMLALYTLLAMAYPFWGPGVSLALRVRFGFATVIPSNALSLVLTFPLGFVSDRLFVLLIAGTLAGALILDTLTATRGAFADRDFGDGLARGLGFAILVLGIALIASFLLQIAVAVVMFHNGILTLPDAPAG